MGDRYVVMVETTRRGKPWMKIVANVDDHREARDIRQGMMDGRLGTYERVIIRKVGKRKKKKTRRKRKR